MYKPTSDEEKEFLKNYDISKYERPAVTADIVVFKIDDDFDISILLIKRKNYPFKNFLALPGGFAEKGESLEETAARELYEETCIKNINLKQIGVFSTPGRDPRGWIISAAFMGFAPQGTEAIANDDAREAKFVKFKVDKNGLMINNNPATIAFDHNDIILRAYSLMTANNRNDFEFLRNKNAFTITEFKKIREAIHNIKEDPSNLKRDLLNAGYIKDTGKKSNSNGHNAALFKTTF